MISNQNMTDTQPTSRGTKKSGTSIARRFIPRLPLKETKQRQARDQEAHRTDMPEPMDVSQRESSRPLLAPRLAPRSVQKPSVHALCYKLDLGNDMPERPPRIEYITRRDSASSDMALQTAQIFRGVQISEDGTVVSENSRATRSNAGKKPRQGKRSRQAANIHRARDLVDEAIETDGDSDMSAKVLSLVVIGEYGDTKDLIRHTPRKLRKLDLDQPISLAFNGTSASLSTRSTLPQIV